MILCPFCMKSHDSSITECPDKKIKIPSTYIHDSKKGTPVVFMFTVGYSGHTKTCFLSSFFHTLYHGAISKRWPGFSFIGLTMETLNKIHDEYVNILEQGVLPPKTAIMFPTPLILKLQQMPLKVKRLFRRSTIKQREIIFIFYDIGGGTYEVDEKIKQNLPILNQINTLIFLINLPGLIDEAQEGISVVQKLHNLLNTVYLAIEELEQTNKKNIIICFTKADLMWDKEDIYGPLAKRSDSNMPSISEVSDYFDETKQHSEYISEYIYKHYERFHTTLYNNFNSVYFTSLAPLGTQPEDNKMSILAPSRIFDPMLLTLRLEGYL